MMKRTYGISITLTIFLIGATACASQLPPLPTRTSANPTAAALQSPLQATQQPATATQAEAAPTSVAPSAQPTQVTSTMTATVEAAQPTGAVTTTAEQPALGIVPEQISFNYQGLAQGVHAEAISPPPFDPNSLNVLDYQPIHLRYVFDDDQLPDYVAPNQRQLLIYPTAAYLDLPESLVRQDASNSITALRSLITDRPDVISGTIPVLPLLRAQQTLTAQVKYLDFAGGAGVRFIAYYSQNVAPITNDAVFYTFQGLTDDNRYYVSFFHPISPTTGILSDTINLSAAEYDAFAANFEAYLVDTQQKLNALGPADFTPSLDQLDGLVTSLQILHEAPTTVVRFVPQLPTETRDGSCFTHSIALPNRDDAWRCTVENEIFDPCVVGIDGQSLVCGADPAVMNQEGFTLNLTQPLPQDAVIAPTPQAGGLPRPWLIQFRDGTYCNAETGAMGVVDGQPITYLCSDGTGVVGDLKQGTTWEAQRAMIKLEATSASLSEPRTDFLATVWE